MSSHVARLSGDDWQRWANKLLSTHYGPTEYQAVPDNDRGDAGIEGFTVTGGEAFQAYGCEEPIDTKKRFEAQRNKMTRDIKKFIDNRVLLQRLFGAIVIKRWVLFVPYFDSKEIVSHAATKTQEVLAENLPYVSSDFRVIVSQEDDFPVAKDQLINAGLRTLAVDGARTTEEEQSKWAQKNHDLSSKLDAKLRKLPTIKSDAQRDQFQKQILKWHLDGQSIHDALRAYPEVYQKVIQIKAHRENHLASTFLSEVSGHDILRVSISNLREAFEREVNMLGSRETESLTHEAVADWLLRCPLDFPDIS